MVGAKPLSPHYLIYTTICHILLYKENPSTSRQHGLMLEILLHPEMIILWKYIYKKINVPSSSTLDILFVNSPEPKETVVDLPSDLFHQKSPPFTAHSTQLKHLNDFGFLFVQIFAHVRGLNVFG